VAWISRSALRHYGGGHTKNTLALKVGKVSSRIHTVRFLPAADWSVNVDRFTFDADRPTIKVSMPDAHLKKIVILVKIKKINGTCEYFINDRRFLLESNFQYICK